MPSPPKISHNPDNQDVASDASFREVSLAFESPNSSTDDVQKPLNPDGFDEKISKEIARQPARPNLVPGTSSIPRRPSFIDEEDDPIVPLAAEDDVSNGSPKESTVTWSSLPKKGQLAVLTIARLSEPLTERSLAAYLFYQLRFFNPELPDSTITRQGGMLTASFAAAQFLTAVWWGRAADTPWIGRKKVLLVGLVGTTISCIGVGFSKSFAQALFFRACAGCLNGNVGVMRTMISEIIQEKK